MRKTWVQSLDEEDSLEKEMATQSSILAWEIPWTKDPAGLQSIGLQKVGPDLATEHAHTCFVTEANIYKVIFFYTHKIIGNKNKKLIKE